MCPRCQKTLAKARQKLADRYHNDEAYREKRRTQGRESYLRHAERKRALAYKRLVEAGAIKSPKQCERYGIENPSMGTPLATNEA